MHLSTLSNSVKVTNTNPRLFSGAFFSVTSATSSICHTHTHTHTHIHVTTSTPSLKAGYSPLRTDQSIPSMYLRPCQSALRPQTLSWFGFFGPREMLNQLECAIPLLDRPDRWRVQEHACSPLAWCRGCVSPVPALSPHPPTSPW